jgi:hypothetical protein
VEGKGSVLIVPPQIGYFGVCIIITLWWNHQGLWISDWLFRLLSVKIFILEKVYPVFLIFFLSVGNKILWILGWTLWV